MQTPTEKNGFWKKFIKVATLPALLDFWLRDRWRTFSYNCSFQLGFLALPLQVWIFADLIGKALPKDYQNRRLNGPVPRNGCQYAEGDSGRQHILRLLWESPGYVRNLMRITQIVITMPPYHVSHQWINKRFERLGLIPVQTVKILHWHMQLKLARG